MCIQVFHQMKDKLNMQFKIDFFIGQSIIFCNLLFFLSAKALVGYNVRQVEEGEFQFVVNIGLIHSTNTETFDQFCTGSLVSNRDVLTAEHCLQNKDQDFVRIIIGSRDMRLGTRYSPLWWITYEQWANQRRIRLQYAENDLAMIRLCANVSAEIQPGIVGNFENVDLVDWEVTLAGWGTKDDGRKPFIMQAADVNVISLKECQDRIEVVQGEPIEFEPTVFCTSSQPYILVHNGDSGGPVIYMNIIIGVTKGNCPFPTMDLHPEKLNIHFGTLFYRHFILDIIYNAH